MNNENINIILNDKNDSRIEEFEKNEWSISDLEHYGKNDIDFTKRKYKFIAENNIGDIV
jgi:hypothetical protein